MDLTSKIMAYETGELSHSETLKMFAELVRNGMAWTLQGHYGRTAAKLIELGYLNRQGEILRGFDCEN